MYQIFEKKTKVRAVAERQCAIYQETAENLQAIYMFKIHVKTLELGIRIRALEGWNPVNRFNAISWMTVGTPTDRLKSVRNRCVIDSFGVVS